jgi:hypothetical protein
MATREEIYLQILSEKTGEPSERLTLALDRVKERLQDDLSDDLGELQANYLGERLRKMTVSQIIGMTRVLALPGPWGMEPSHEEEAV